MKYLLILTAGLLLTLGGCKKEAPAATGTATAELVPNTAEKAPADQKAGAAAGKGGANAAPKQTEPVPRSEAADSGPTIVFKTGRIGVDERPAQTVQAATRAEVDGHTYLSIPVPPGLRADRWSRDLARFRIAGAAHGNVALSKATLWVRLVGPAPDRLSVEIWHREGRSRELLAWTHQTITIEGIKAAKGEGPAQQAAFFTAWSDFMRVQGEAGWGRVAPFYAFASARAAQLAGKAVPSARQNRPARRSELGKMMSLYTGATSVEEALQADRGLLLRGQGGKATVDLASIPGVPLAAHPWAEMLKDLGKTPQIEPLAARVPNDVVYLHFADLRTAVKMADDLDTWLTPASQLVEWRSGASFIAQRYQTQLMLERSELSRRFGNLAAGGVAFLADDPFVREGTAVAMLFEVKSATLLDSTLGRYEAAARRRRADLEEVQWEYRGVSVRRVATPDGVVDQNRFTLDGVLTLTNSKAFARRLIDVAKGQAPALKDSGDYRYLRAIYPFDPKAEDGYLFISDAFVARAVSPRMRILQARRMAGQADLAAVGYAALLDGMLEAKPPADLAALLASGYLTAAELKHADGSPITWDPKHGARSERWGRVGVGPALADLPLEKVSEAERLAYERFKKTYQSYWRSYIDPIAVRIQRDADGKRLAFDARMLPLIDGTDYDHLVQMVGSARVSPPKLKNAIQWTYALGQGSRLRHELDGIEHMVGVSGLGFGWLGGWVMVGAKDTSALFDMLVVAESVPTLPMSRAERKELEDKTLFGVIDRLPVYVGAHVKNPLGLVATLTALRAFVQSSAPGMVRWVEGPEVAGTKTVRIEVTPPKSWTGGATLSLHYAVAGDVFLASMDFETLAELIEEAKAGAMAQPDEAPDAPQTSLGIVMRRAEGWLSKGLLALAEVEAFRQRAGMFRDAEVLWRGLGHRPTRAEALAYLGFEPSAVQGGTLSMKDGRLYHSVYGFETEPVAPAIPLKGGPITDLIQSTERLIMGLGFEGEGRTRGLHATLEWRRR